MIDLKAQYLKAARLDLRNLIVNLGYLSAPVHYLSALQAIGKWLEGTGKGYTAEIEARRHQEED